MEKNMDAIFPAKPEKLIQGQETESRLFWTDCLGVPLILRKVLEHFSNEELLELSCVNKQWNYEARSLMKNRSSLIARFSSQDPCLDLTAFASDVIQMNVVPVCGVEVVVRETEDHANECCNSSSRSLWSTIVDRVPWKYFSLILSVKWVDNKGCIAYLLAKKIVRKYGPLLEQLSIQLYYGQEVFIQDYLGQCSFPRLKILKLTETSEYIVASTALIKALVSRAPNLQVIYKRGRVDLTENFLHGSSAVLVTDYRIDPINYEISESLIHALRTKKIFLGASFSENFFSSRLSRITPMLLQSSRSTLTYMEMDALFLLPLQSFRICFNSVEVLILYLNCRCLKTFQPSVLRLVKDFDFTRIFPCLTRVYISVQSRAPSDFHNEITAFIVEQWNAALTKPSPDRAANIQSVSLCGFPLNEFTIQFIAEMFPHVKKLSLTTFEVHKLPYSFLWQHKWIDLEEIEIMRAGTSSLTWHDNLDRLFCGIFCEEIALLQKQDEEYLRSVNIVPVMPSITNLKGLRKFKLFYKNTHDGALPVIDPTYMFSKVTGLLAFKRCHLGVTVATDSREVERDVSHLKPYASVVRLVPTSFRNVWWTLGKF